MIIASDAYAIIRKITESHIQELGEGEGAQEIFLNMYLNQAMRKMASFAYYIKTSDVLLITDNGYQTFLLTLININDEIYSPLRLLDSTGRAARKRTSFTDPKGWFKESANVPVHTKGIAGPHTLQYLSYPSKIVDASSVLEFPESALLGLCYHTSGMILESSAEANVKDIAKHYYTLGDQHMKIAVKANEDARGRKPGKYWDTPQQIDTYFRG